MASPSLVELTIAVTSGVPTSEVTVEYRATFTPAEVVGNLGSLETIQLFGEDPPNGPAGDDVLFTFPALMVVPGGAAVQQISRSAVVPNLVLDEDPGVLEDQISARVTLGLNSASSVAVSQ